MMGGPRRRGAPMPRMSIKGQGHILKRLMKIVFENYLWQFIAVIVCIVVTAYATIQSSTFTRDLVDVYIAGIQKGTKTMGDLANAMIPLGCVLALGVAASYIRQRLMVSVGQGTMLKIRTDLFTHMESLNKVASGQIKEIHRCVRCNKKCLGGLQQHQGTHCIYEKV